jgi:hypothetical protein
MSVGNGSSYHRNIEVFQPVANENVGPVLITVKQGEALVREQSALSNQELNAWV